MIKILSEQDGGDSAMNRSWDSSRNLDEQEAGGANYGQGCNERLGIHVCRQAQNELPAQLAISLIQGKWKMRILSQLQQGPVRLSQLRKMFPGASKKMLTQHLREMEEDGLSGVNYSSPSATIIIPYAFVLPFLFFPLLLAGPERSPVGAERRACQQQGWPDRYPPQLAAWLSVPDSRFFLACSIR